MVYPRAFHPDHAFVRPSHFKKFDFVSLPKGDLHFVPIPLRLGSPAFCSFETLLGIIYEIYEGRLIIEVGDRGLKLIKFPELVWL